MMFLNIIIPTPTTLTFWKDMVTVVSFGLIKLSTTWKEARWQTTRNLII
jgi:hypothetical protein